MSTVVKFLKGMWRLPLWVRAWLVLLMAANMVAPLFFIDRVEARAVLVAFVGGFLLLLLITRLSGFTRLLGLGHILWVPLIAYLLSRPAVHAGSDTFGVWLRAVVGLNAVSLVIDFIDVVRYVRGDRTDAVPDIQP